MTWRNSPRGCFHVSGCSVPQDPIQGYLSPIALPVSPCTEISKIPLAAAPLAEVKAARAMVEATSFVSGVSRPAPNLMA